jgi:hypothetical protein
MLLPPNDAFRTANATQPMVRAKTHCSSSLLHGNHHLA